MTKIVRTVKIKEVNDVLNCSFPKEIQNDLIINKGDLLEMTFDSSKPDILLLKKINLKNNNVWFMIGDRYWWLNQIRDGSWGLANSSSPDMKLFESIKPKDIILAYYKSPIKSIKNILITNRGFSMEDETIDIHNIHNLKYPITYDDFKSLNILSDYQKMPRRSVVPVNRPDWEKIINTISKRDNVELDLKISKFIKSMVA